MRRRAAIVVVFAVALAGLPSMAVSSPAEDLASAVSRALTGVPRSLADTVLTAPARETEPVVLTGADVAGWAAPGDVALARPDLGGLRCQGNREVFGDTPLTPESTCTHNAYEDQLSAQTLLAAEGTPTRQLLAYRWDGRGFTQVPFQVDEVFTRHLSNNVSGFSVYSNTDRHTSYAFDREGFRWTDSDRADPCLAAAASALATDPVPGLDTDDELVFMARDAGSQAPADAPLPAGVEDAYEVAVVDPVAAVGAAGYVYLMKATPDGPAPAFDATNGYVRYERDADADVFRFSQSSYSNYGNAPRGPWRDDNGVCHDAESEWKQRRPGDQATVTTARYRFRYDGRWLMTGLQVSDDAEGDWTYGADMVDQWKARAFQQRPGGQTPCCGYEEEVNNWGGSSQLLGERAGPVRVIRETWGADSGTNVVRREVFYRDEIRQRTYLRVHVVPPLDGIYAQWDHTAGAVTEYYNPLVPEGVAVDGRNDEAFGNSRLHAGFDGVSVDGSDSVSELVRDLSGGTPLTVGAPNEPDCSPPEPVGSVYDDWDDLCIYNDVDSPDPLFSGVNALLSWEQLSGPAGTLVTRWSPVEMTPGGTAQGLLAVPYYRDDSCFDDGTGTDPGPHLNSRREDSGAHATWTDGDGVVRPRECWDAERHATDPDYAAQLGSRRFWQGSVGTHGLHILLIADSDNALTTLPLTEINAEQRMVVLPPTEGNVGERYGREFEKPLLTVATPFTGAPSGSPEEPAAGWLAGDLHVHSTYSHDSYGGPGDDNTGPEEAYTAGLSVEAQFASAVTRGLDFVAITDHNDVRAQQDPGYGAHGVIPVPGYEKSLHGHAQMLGATRLYDAGDRSAPAVQAVADELRADGGIFQINHPAEGATDPHDLDWGYGTEIVPDAVEVWNISRLWQPPLPSASSNDDAIRFWESLLDAGHRVAATGGSDTHWAATSAVQGVGQPTTWVYASDRSHQAVLDAIRDGHTFISHQPPALGGPRLVLEADGDGDGTFESLMGDTVSPGSTLRARVDGAAGAQLRLLGDGGNEVSPPVTVGAGSVEHTFTVPEDTTWVRAEVGLPDAEELRAATCDPLVGTVTTYCRNGLLVLAMTSALYLREPVVPTTITLAAPSSGAYGDGVEVEARLATTDGQPVAGEELTLTLGSAATTAVTDADGIVTATLVPTDEPGEAQLRASFAGTDAHGPSEVRAAFEIVRETTVLTWAGDDRLRGNTVTFAARLTEDDGPPVVGREVVFEAGGQTWSAVTGADGLATVQAEVTPLARELAVTARFAGDALYEPSTTTTVLRRRLLS